MLRPKRAPAAPEPEYEAMAATLNSRDEAFQYHGLTFPPGEWVPVTPSQAGALAWHEAITVRVREVPNG